MDLYVGRWNVLFTTQRVRTRDLPQATQCQALGSFCSLGAQRLNRKDNFWHTTKEREWNPSCLRGCRTSKTSLKSHLNMYRCDNWIKRKELAAMILGGRLDYNRVVIESYRLYCTANVHNLQSTQVCNLTRGVPEHLRPQVLHHSVSSLP